MAPGIYKLDDMEKGGKVSIRVRNNPYPFAVCISEVNAATEFCSSLTRPRGKAGQVVHLFGDMLWKDVPVSIPNAGFSLLTVVSSDGQDGDSSDSDESKEDDDAAGGEEGEDDDNDVDEDVKSDGDGDYNDIIADDGGGCSVIRQGHVECESDKHLPNDSQQLSVNDLSISQGRNEAYLGK
jgi:hypothetical protein